MSLASKKSALCFLFLLLLCLFFLPQILSSSLGKPFFERAFGKKLHANVQIGSLHLSWLGPQRLQNVSLTSPEMTGSIDEVFSDTPLWSLSQFGDSFLLKNGTFSFSAFDHVQLTKVNAKIQNQEVQAEGLASQGGSFSIRGIIHTQSDLDLIADFRDMPPAPLDQFLRANGLLNAALGATMNLSGEIIYHKGAGRLKMDLSSPNSQLSIEGNLIENSLVLTKPLNASLNWNPQLGQILKEKTSLSLIQALNPFRLSIPADSAKIPLFPFSIEKLKIENGVLDLGQVVFYKIKTVNSLLTLLKQAPSSHMPVWFSPLFFSIDQGIFYGGRVDALISQSVHVCAWGNIDIASSNLDLIFGIPADTLTSAFEIKGLSRNYVLKIPVRGPISDPSFETKSAASKIAAMVTGQQLSKKAGIFGTLFDSFSRLNDDQNNPPPNRPFPWEK